MKKIILITITLFIILTGCTKGALVTINYNELKDKLDNKESFILFIGSDDCSNCKNYKGTIDTIIKKYRITYYYINIEGLSSEESTKLRQRFYFSGVPTTVFIKNGKEENQNLRIIGAQDYSEVVKKLKKAEYIKEK